MGNPTKAEQAAEAVEFIKLNAPYLSFSAMSVQLGASPRAMDGFLADAGIDQSDLATEPRAFHIASDLKFLPLGTQVEQWAGGTCFHLPCDIPGTLRVTRHYAADDE